MRLSWPAVHSGESSNLQLQIPMVGVQDPLWLNSAWWLWESFQETRSSICLIRFPNDSKIHHCTKQLTKPQTQEIYAFAAEWIMFSATKSQKITSPF